MNIGWGYTKIRDAMRGLKIDIGRTTVANILTKASIEPAPERTRKQTWKHFLRSHWETLYACDFFAVESFGIFGTVRYMVFSVMELRSRAVHIAGVYVDPDGRWMMQVARNLLDTDDGFLRNATHLIHDRDPLYTKRFGGRSRADGCPGARLSTGDRSLDSLTHWRPYHATRRDLCGMQLRCRRRGRS